jgi:hypothetical protein
MIEDTRVFWLGLREGFNLTNNLNHLSMSFLPMDRVKDHSLLTSYTREGGQKEQSRAEQGGRRRQGRDGGRGMETGEWRVEQEVGGRLGVRGKEGRGEGKGRLGVRTKEGRGEGKGRLGVRRKEVREEDGKGRLGVRRMEGRDEDGKGRLGVRRMEGRGADGKGRLGVRRMEGRGAETGDVRRGGERNGEAGCWEDGEGRVGGKEMREAGVEDLVWMMGSLVAE